MADPTLNSRGCSPWEIEKIDVADPQYRIEPVYLLINFDVGQSAAAGCGGWSHYPPQVYLPEAGKPRAMQGLIRYSGSGLDTILAEKSHSFFSITSAAGIKKIVVG